MLKAVVDTNVLVSGTILSRGNPFEILEAWRRYEFTLITSPEINSEIEAVLRRPRFYKEYGLTESLVSRLITVLNLEALAVNPKAISSLPGIEPADLKLDRAQNFRKLCPRLSRGNSLGHWLLTPIRKKRP